VSTHLALPLLVAAVHVALGVGAAASGRDRPTQWLFAALAGVLALAALGVYQIRHAPDAAGGLLGQRVLHLTFALTPAVYYHLVCRLTRTVETRRTTVRMVYAGAAVFVLVSLLVPSLLVREVVRTPREWAPVTGPLGLLLFAYYLAVMVATLRPLRGAQRKALVAASLVMLLAPLVNFVAVFLVQARVIGLAVPSLRMPASVVFIALVWFATRENAT
jgi:hypothetical protein